MRTTQANALVRLAKPSSPFGGYFQVEAAPNRTVGYPWGKGMNRVLWIDATCAGLLAVLGAVACGATDEGTGTGAGTGSISERAFDVTAHVKLTEPDALIDDCGDFQFTGRFRKLDDNWIFEAASAEEVVQTKVTEIKPGSYAAQPVDSGFDDAPVLFLPDACDHVHWLANLTFVDSGHGPALVLTSFSANGSGSRHTSCGDCEYEEAEELTLEGTPDTAPPGVSLPKTGLNPLEPTSIAASEALLDARASVTSPNGDALDVPTHGSTADAIWSFEVPPLLALGTTFKWRADGSDWAGNLLKSQGSLHTLPDAGILTPDGFESDVTALSGSPKVVEEGALSGKRSLRVDRYRDATFHLQRTGATKLLFQFQPQLPDLSGLSENEDVSFSFVRVRFGTLGGTQVQSFELAVSATVARQTTPLAPVSVERDLVEPGDDVVVTFELEEEDTECGLIACADVVSLIDDLHLE